MPADLLTRPPASPVQRTTAGATVVIASVVLLAVFAVITLAAPPPRIDGPTITNPGPYEVLVETRSPGETTRTAVGYLPRESTVRFRQTIDQGETWVLLVRSGGADGGEVTVGRDELRAGYTIPDEVVTALADGGAVESPPPLTADG